jgi:hypothetical protein
MLYLPRTTADASPPNSTKIPLLASGRDIKRLLHGMSPSRRAFLAAKLVTGDFAYVSPTVAQAARICRVPASRVHAELGHAPRPLSDSKVDRMIARYGADTFMRGLDRHTAPRFAVAAE